ncbi:type II toxin-antitoxin system VapC family toxin [Adlercreutzia sp. R21]|uniref:type II toxin-antitoxin system VapC family toxin n=1 Tax=Adlercreutzia wanghongyangiae TaxID=3111451 RepID=UPI002DB7F43D|nr:type II toxin-antitoxin system VapC family toxin [Adlercreutzia sp. R21]MEC4183550.1 type II toxin-antitoxin system VapC family toxin [Adlercreutzia sp. R21]
MVVIDVNAAVAMAQGTEEGKALRLLLGKPERIVAPRLFLEEMGNVAWKYAAIGDISEDDALRLFWKAAELVDYYADTEPLLAEAINEAIRHNHPVYDMIYFVLARRNAATLFTLDKKLRAICESSGVNSVGAIQL